MPLHKKTLFNLKGEQKDLNAIKSSNTKKLILVRPLPFHVLTNALLLSCRDERKSYIKAKYEEKKFVQPYCSNAQEIFSELEQSIATHNLYDLLQTYAEAGFHGVDLTDPLPASVSLNR